MSRAGSRGFTLVEILVYTFLSAIVMTALISLFIVGQRSGAEATSSYLLGRAVDEAVRVLREDLQGAPLNSVRVDRSPPRLTFLSASPMGGGPMVLGRYGAPVWQKRVGYGLEVKGRAATGTLVRWEEKWDSPVPAAAPSAPSIPSSGARVVLREVVAPGTSVPGAEVDPGWGGFRPMFVRYGWQPRVETLSDVNPAVVTATAGDPARLDPLTRLMDLRIQILEQSGSGKAGFVSVSFRVMPRY